MQDLIMALDAKEKEITQWMDAGHEERNHLMRRITELDEQLAAADNDLRRINKARNALRNPDEEEMSMEEAKATAGMDNRAMPTRAMPQYFPATNPRY